MEIRGETITGSVIRSIEAELPQLSTYHLHIHYVLNVHFIDCHFPLSSRIFSTVYFRECTFENCLFSDCSFHYDTFELCTFINITFVDNPRTCINKCTMADCSIDDSFRAIWNLTGKCPPNGEFIAWKKAHDTMHNVDVIVKLLIPNDAKRINAFTNKCRSDKAVVLDIQDVDGNSLDRPVKCISLYDADFKYKVGKTVKPVRTFDENIFQECSDGIHFFMSREEAVNYTYY